MKFFLIVANFAQWFLSALALLAICIAINLNSAAATEAAAAKEEMDRPNWATSLHICSDIDLSDTLSRRNILAEMMKRGADRTYIYVTHYKSFDQDLECVNKHNEALGYNVIESLEITARTGGLVLGSVQWFPEDSNYRLIRHVDNERVETFLLVYHDLEGAAALFENLYFDRPHTLKLDSKFIFDAEEVIKSLKYMNLLKESRYCNICRSGPKDSSASHINISRLQS